MTIGLLVLCAALILTVALLLIRLLSLRAAIREISEEVSEKLREETNTLITVSSGDRRVRELAAALSRQLEELRTQRRRYEQGDTEVREAVTNIAHDLRTPLTAIRGYLELSMEEEKSEKLSEYLAIISERIDAMQQLTEELFRYSVAASAADLTLERVNLRRLLEECVLSFYGALHERGIEPELTLADGDRYAILDLSAARRVISNILSNCVKYSDGDLKITMDPDGTMVFANHAENLDAVKVGRLFDRFYTVESPGKSTGLGLSIARALTERMKGTIRADYGEGILRISLSFPAVP